MHHYIRTLLEEKATLKWYRTVPVRNLTGGAEGDSACTLSGIGTGVGSTDGGKR